MEDGKNAKKYYVGKNMSCSFFSKFIKKKFISTQIIASEKPPKKYAVFDARVPISLKKIIKLEKIYKAFPDFNYNLQQYSLFYSLFLYGV